MKSAICLILLLAACDSGKDSEAPTKCRKLAATLCNTTVRCDPATQFAACYASAQTQLECDKAAGIGGTFDACIATLERAQCSDTDAPTACVDVIEVAQ